MPTFEFPPTFYRDHADLIIEIRNCRLAHAAAHARVAEWNQFAAQIRRGQRVGSPISTLIAETRSWASGWWKRAHARRGADARV
jgi:hypothetical protein